MLESLDLWERHGPCAALLAKLRRATLVTVALCVAPATRRCATCSR